MIFRHQRLDHLSQPALIHRPGSVSLLWGAVWPYFCSPALPNGISVKAPASYCLQGPACPFHLKPAAPPRLPWTYVLDSTAGFLQATEDRTQTRSQTKIYVCSWSKCQECEMLQTGSYERKGSCHNYPIKTFRKEKVTTKVPMQGKQVIIFQDTICKFTLLHKSGKIENKSSIVSCYLI